MFSKLTKVEIRSKEVPMSKDVTILEEVAEQDLENINGGAVSITNTIVTAPTPQYQVLLQKIISELDHK